MVPLLEEELIRRLCETAGLDWSAGEQRHRGDQRGGGDRRPERGSRCQQPLLAQRFKELIGVTPKRLARTYCFAVTVFAINQAYFSHEFRAFTGPTPDLVRPNSNPRASGLGGFAWSG
ncbi:hypothetical protein [Streptomyces sp. WAC 05379]|uniref:hypothetical protein n=1 Tax=Streptomyces sp. WAC 05379 TaxID=2203207 RepID=UPI001C8CA075|nr:hypothetical protein [Streptomyces sp. WAC 05379]